MEDPVTLTTGAIALYVLCPTLAVLAVVAFVLWRVKKKKKKTIGVTNG